MTSRITNILPDQLVQASIAGTLWTQSPATSLMKAQNLTSCSKFWSQTYTQAHWMPSLISITPVKGLALLMSEGITRYYIQTCEHPQSAYMHTPYKVACVFICITFSEKTQNVDGRLVFLGSLLAIELTFPN
jgi:hypothetical protein